MRERLLAACDRLGVDPYVDGETRFIFPTPPAMFMRLWRDGEFWAVYTFDDEGVGVINMGREGVDAYDFRC